MRPSIRPPAARSCVSSIFAILALAGCASDRARVEGLPESPDKPGTFAVIDGKVAPIPDVRMGDPRTVARIIEEGANRNQVMNHLTHLSTKIGPRLTGSSNTEAANRWARDQFEAWGLSIPPFGGADGQSSEAHDLRGLWQWGQVSARFDRGPSTGKIVAVRNPGSSTPEYRTLRDVEFTTLSWTAGTSGPVRGPVVKMPENDAQLESVKDKIKGAWVLVKPSTGNRRGVVGGASARIQLYSDFRKRWATGEAPVSNSPPVDPNMTHYEGTVSGGPIPDGTPFELDVNLSDPKAVVGKVSFGGFRVSDMIGATYDPGSGELKFRTESQRGNRDYTLRLQGETLAGQTVLPENGGTMTYAAKKTAVEQPPQGPTMEERVLKLEPAGWILAASGELVITSGLPGWDKLDVSNASKDLIVTVRKSDYDCMNSSLTDGVPVEAEFDLKHSLVGGPIPVYDTIAEIKGSEWPDEVVIVSGHLDSWDGPGSQGTTDNGTGSAVTLEAARLLATVKAQPRRTIRFILWTGEEQGLLGSVAYVKYLKDHNKLESVSAVLVDDGGTNYEGGLPCVASQVPYLAAATAPVNGYFYSEKDGKFLNVNIHAEKTFTQVNGSDHNSFMREKIPGFFWDEEGRADYNHTHHTQYDNIEQAIPEYLEQSSTCAAVTAYNLACAPTMLPRPTDEEWPQRGGRRGGGPPAQPAPANPPPSAPARN